MGKQGTDVAKESADIIIADDNFASIVRGVLEGRVAYANIRKVIFLLVSTGAAELLLFLLTIPLGLPMPLLPVQLLWLNLVTNGVQHIALAAERPEGDELTYPPRRPQEPIFDRVMVIRNAYSAFVMAGVGFAMFYWLIARGYTTDSARNLLLLLFVVFENFQALNARSERHSLFYKGIFSSSWLLASVIGAQVIHLIAAHVPLLADTLRIQPPTLAEWGALVALGSSLLVVMEFEKWWGEHRRAAPAPARETTPTRAGFSRRYPLASAGIVLLVTAAAGGLLYWQSARESLKEELTTVDRGDHGQIDEGARSPPPPSPLKASAPISGTIETVACNNGDLVEAGYVCARILPPDLQREVARLHKALAATEAMQTQAEVMLRRARSAYDSAVKRRVANTSKAKARTAVARAKTRLSRAETEMKRCDEALRAMLDKGTPVSAPITGVVHESRLKPGAEAAAGDTIFVIAPGK